MRCSVNKNRRQSVKDIVFLLLILGIIKGRKDCLVIGNCFGNSFSKKFG